MCTCTAQGMPSYRRPKTNPVAEKSRYVLDILTLAPETTNPAFTGMITTIGSKEGHATHYPRAAQLISGPDLSEILPPNLNAPLFDVPCEKQYSPQQRNKIRFNFEYSNLSASEGISFQGIKLIRGRARRRAPFSQIRTAPRRRFHTRFGA